MSFFHLEIETNHVTVTAYSVILASMEKSTNPAHQDEASEPVSRVILAKSNVMAISRVHDATRRVSTARMINQI
jgi:hypothetical protein